MDAWSRVAERGRSIRKRRPPPKAPLPGQADPQAAWVPRPAPLGLAHPRVTILVYAPQASPSPDLFRGALRPEAAVRRQRHDGVEADLRPAALSRREVGDVRRADRRRRGQQE